jgi:hypothetical protein
MVASAIISGHTVHDGGGAFDNFEDLRVGATVVITTTSGRITYAASSVTNYPKRSLARQAAQVFDQTRPGRLVARHLRGLERPDLPQQPRRHRPTRPLTRHAPPSRITDPSLSHTAARPAPTSSANNHPQTGQSAHPASPSSIAWQHPATDR